MLNQVLFVLSTGLWGYCIYLLLAHKREPASTIAWMLFVSFLPFFGPLVFLFLGPQRLVRKALKRSLRLASLASQESGTQIHLDKLSSPEKNVLKVMSHVSELRPTSGNNVTLWSDPETGLLAMRRAIEKAERFIHLEYYIISNDEATEELFQDLMAAAQRGVTIRILYDAFGSLSLKRLYLRKLIQSGIQVAGFLPFSPFPQHINPHFRNHRKILVIDGKRAFTGGANIGKEYLGVPWKKQWRDHFLEITGPACAQLERVFAKDWLYTTREDLFREPYLVSPKASGDSLVQVLESGPDTEFEVMRYAVLLAIQSAEKEILLTTPYFIPDGALSASLAVAALKGVTVQILLPAKSDAPLVRWASRSFYDRLLKSGVMIFEYQPTILHTKMLLIDGKFSLFGSGNMDTRSFRLNFELNAFVFGGAVTSQARRCFEKDRENSKKIDEEVFLKRPLRHRLLENACRLLSPVL